MPNKWLPLSIIILILSQLLISNALSSDIAFNFSSVTKINDYNDDVIFVIKNSTEPYRLLCFYNNGTNDKWQFFESSDIEGPWTLYYSISVPDQETPQWARENETGYWYIYTSYQDSYTRLYIGNPELTNVTLWGQIFANESDGGGFYDPDSGIWHFFPESKSIAGEPCGWAIGHITSPNGKTNWTWHPDIIDIQALGYNWHTGDCDVIKVDDTYYMFVDHTDPDNGNHPYYWIHCFKSTNLYNWTEVGQVTTYYGGDACVRYIPEKGKFYMFNEFWGGPGEKTGYQIYTPSQTLSIDPTYNRMDIYVSSANASEDDSESFGYKYEINYTSTPEPQPSANDTETFGYFYTILYNNATANNGSGFIISHSYNYFYIAASLAVFFPIFGFVMYKWRAK